MKKIHTDLSERTNGGNIKRMGSLSAYLEELRTLPPEVPLEPEFKNQDRQKQDKKIRLDLGCFGSSVFVLTSCHCDNTNPREEQDLRGGAVMSAVIEEGESDETPNMGDLVRRHRRMINAIHAR